MKFSGGIFALCLCLGIGPLAAPHANPICIFFIEVGACGLGFVLAAIADGVNK